MAAASVPRDRSPLRNGTEPDPSRIKEEPKRDEDIMMRQASVVNDPRYHHPSAQSQMQAHSQAQAQAAAAAAAAQHHYMASRHGQHILPPPPHSHLSRAMMAHPMGGPPMSHYPPPSAGGWPTPLDPYGRDPYRMDPMHQLRFNPLIEHAIRADAEERAKAMSIYAAHSAAHLRSKEPSPVPPPQHHRMNPGSMKPSPSHMAVGPNGHPVSVDMHKKEDTTSAR